MRSPANDRGRPVTTQTASRMSTLTDTPDCTDDRPRCVRCGHVVFTAPAILTGLGRDCRRIVVRAAREVVA